MTGVEALIAEMDVPAATIGITSRYRNRIFVFASGAGAALDVDEWDAKLIGISVWSCTIHPLTRALTLISLFEQWRAVYTLDVSFVGLL